MEKYSIDIEQWSEESKRSFRYYALQSASDYYSDIKYHCISCNEKAIFSAKEQKISYEIEKNYIWQVRKLCPGCYGVLQHIKSKLSEHDRFLDEGNETGLTEYLSLLRELPRYGRKINRNAENRIKILQNKKP